MVMNPFPFTMIQFSCLNFFFLLLSSSFFAAPASPAATEELYADYCSSTIPEVVPMFGRRFRAFEHKHTGFFLVGDTTSQLSFPDHINSFSFWIRRLHYTYKDDVFRAEASLAFECIYYPSAHASLVPEISWLTAEKLELYGFWSRSSGEMCLVEKEGNKHSLTTLLKIYNFEDSSKVTSLITGTLEMFHYSTYSGPVSILIVPKVNDEYNFATRRARNLFRGKTGSDQNLPLSALSSTRSFCSIFASKNTAFWLKYASDCSSAKDCLPFSGLVDFVPHYVTLTQLDCSKRLRVLVNFPNGSLLVNTFFNPNSALVGEGFWDDKKNELSIVLCRFLGITESWSNAHIGDCTTRLSLRFPAVLSVRQSSRILGQIWSTKTANDSGFFKNLVFSEILDPYILGDLGMKYEYSETNRVKNLCPVEVISKDEEMNGFAHNLDSYITVTDSEGDTGRGTLSPVSFGDSIYKSYNYYPVSGPVNVSYKVKFTIFKDHNVSYSESVAMRISAEGIYDPGTGRLCMVGCRNIKPVCCDHQHDTVALDCDVLLDFQLLFFQKTHVYEGYVKGSIESLRNKESDPLYFDPIEVISYGYKDYRT